MFEMKKGALYQKEDLIDLTLNTALMRVIVFGLKQLLNFV